MDFDDAMPFIRNAALDLADDSELAASVDMTLDEFKSFVVQYPQLIAIIEKNRAKGRTRIREKYWDYAFAPGGHKYLRDLGIKYLGLGENKGINIEIGTDSKESELSEDQLRLISKIVTLDSSKIDEVNRLLA